MELMQVVRSRRSVRKYRPDPVPQAKIDHVIEAARLAPSWANGQCWTFIVVTDPRVKRGLAEAGNEWREHAPVIIAACADPQESGTKGDQRYYLLDIGIAMDMRIRRFWWPLVWATGITSRASCLRFVGRIPKSRQYF